MARNFWTSLETSTKWSILAQLACPWSQFCDVLVWTTSYRKCIRMHSNAYRYCVDCIPDILLHRSDVERSENCRIPFLFVLWQTDSQSQAIVGQVYSQSASTHGSCSEADITASKITQIYCTQTPAYTIQLVQHRQKCFTSTHLAARSSSPFSLLYSALCGRWVWFSLYRP